MVSPGKNNEIGIGSTQEMIRCLRHSDPVHRASLLRAIRAEPAKALSFTSAEGQDVVDELLFLCEETKGSAERWDYVFTAFSLIDERTVPLAKREFLRTHDHRYIVSAAKRLSYISWEEKVNFLTPILMEPAGGNRCRLAANLLAGADRLAARVAIRIGVLSDLAFTLPTLNYENLDAWVAELQGPYPQKVRTLLLQTDGNALAKLLSYWGRLPDKLRIWALVQGVKQGDKLAAFLVRETIKFERSDELLHTALIGLKNLLPEDHDDELIAPLYQHGNSAIRAAAIRAGVGATKINCASLLCDEVSDDVRLAIVSRMKSGGGEEEIELLISLCQDPNWRIRAGAADALVALAPASLPALHCMLSSAHQEARVAAAQALLRLGKSDWIAQILH